MTEVQRPLREITVPSDAERKRIVEAQTALVLALSIIDELEANNPTGDFPDAGWARSKINSAVRACDSLLSVPYWTPEEREKGLVRK